MMNKLIFILIFCIHSAVLSFNGDLSYSEFRTFQKTFKTVDGKIKYIDEGSGDKVILMIHGVPTSGWLYRKMIDDFVSKGYRVIVPDMLGFGSSDSPNGYDVYASKHQAQRILKLMDSLKIKNWTHMMHDVGGLWTWELFKQEPNRITKLIVLNTIIKQEGFNPPIRMKQGSFAKFSMWLYKNGITTNIMLKKLFKYGLIDGKLSKKSLEGYRIPLKENKTNGMYYFFTNTCNTFPNYDTIIDKIKVPVQIIWGKHDDMLLWNKQSASVIKSLNINLKNIHLIDAKHFIQEEKPELIDSLILSFIK